MHLFELTVLRKDMLEHKHVRKDSWKVSTVRAFIVLFASV